MPSNVVAPHARFFTSQPGDTADSLLARALGVPHGELTSEEIDVIACGGFVFR